MIFLIIYRKIRDIQKYLQSDSNTDLNKVVEFFEAFPEIDKFINLNLTYYFNSQKADELFEKEVKFDDAYKKIFGQKEEEKKID